MRTFNALTSMCWAIEPSALESITQILYGDDASIEALESRIGRSIDGAESITVRDGVAIVPIQGLIFKNATLFTRIMSLIFGGTLTDVLATDIQTALDDRQVHSILLNIDSPGGEAAGINELANMVYAARKKKPMMAYIDGLGTSGAYWLASSAESIAIDEAAILGSIGVVMVVPDSRKMDDRIGITRHQFVSSQSPNKRPDPNTEAGKAEFQKVVDDMAKVFVSAVARNRDVSEETVINDFGRGGLLVGRAAVDAGLADRISSFEDVLSEMIDNQTGTRSFVASGSPQPTTSKGGTMPEEKKEPEKAKVAAAGATAEPPQTESPKEPAKVEEKQEQPKLEQPKVDDDLKTRLAAMEAENAKLKQSNELLGTSVANLEKAARKARFEATAKDFMGEREKHISFMEKIAVAFGEDSDEFKHYVEDQTAHAEQIRKSDLFSEHGSDGEGKGNSAEAQLDALAKERMKADSKLTYAQAYSEALEANPAIYEQYKAETRRRVN